MTATVQRLLRGQSLHQYLQAIIVMRCLTRANTADTEQLLSLLDYGWLCHGDVQHNTPVPGGPCSSARGFSTAVAMDRI